MGAIISRLGIFDEPSIQIFLLINQLIIIGILFILLTQNVERLLHLPSIEHVVTLLSKIHVLQEILIIPELLIRAAICCMNGIVQAMLRHEPMHMVVLFMETPSPNSVLTVPQGCRRPLQSVCLRAFRRVSQITVVQQE